MMRILIYSGKGGVGKTSIAAATAIRLWETGRRVLLMSTDQAHSLGDSLGFPSGGGVRTVREGLDVLELDPLEEGRQAWVNLRDYLKEIIRGRANGGLETEEALLFPGMEELFSLLRILDEYERGDYEILVADCAPTGETLSLLRYPERLSVLADCLLPSVRGINRAFGGLISRASAVPKPRDAVFDEFERLTKRLAGLKNILQNRDAASVRLVTTPERIVMDETRRSYTWMQMYDFGVDAVYINKIYPAEALTGYFADWSRVQEESLELAGESFPEQRQFRLELLSDELQGFEALRRVGRELYGETDPAAVFCREQAFRMEECSGTRILIVKTPYAKEADIQVEKDGGDLLLTVRNQARRFHLTDLLGRRKLSGWSLVDGELLIRLDY